MFGLFYNQRQRQPNPKGAEYNVPFQDIAPGQNTVNITGNAGGTNPDEAFRAFSELYRPFVQSQANLITGTGARPIDAQGRAIPGPPQQYGEQDFENAAQGMFQQLEDRKLLNDYFRRLGRGPFAMR